MPYSPLPASSFSVVLGAGANTELTPQPFDNTKEILILNLDSTNEAWAQFSTTTAALTSTTSIRIPAGTAVTLAIGPVGERNPLRLAASPSPYQAGHAMRLLMRASAGTPTVNVTYVQARGYVNPR